MQPQETSTVGCETGWEVGLLCPCCGDRKVGFHSRSKIVIRSTVESVAIFVCSNSHAFFIPVKNLRWQEVEALGASGCLEIGDLQLRVRDRIARSRQTVLRAAQSVDMSRQLQGKFSRAVQIFQATRGGRPCGLPIQ